MGLIMKHEIFKPIKELENLYEISNKGNFKALEKVVKYKDGRVFFYKEKIIKTHINKKRHGYVYCYAKGKSFRVHVLVARYFINEKPSPIHQVNHIDGNKLNNCASNLEWVTPKKNMKHANDTGLIDYKSMNTKLTKETVVLIYKDAVQGRMSQEAIAKKYGTVQSHVSAIKRRAKRKDVELVAEWKEKK